MNEVNNDPANLLVDSKRIEHKDKAVPADVNGANWSNLQFVRLVAIGKRFTKVKFANTTFDSCYLRDCLFDTCDFTGVRFSGTNLHGAKFTGCVFDYATFERTIIDDSILTDNCPPYENQKMRFARSLRTNYQQLGDAKAANHAIHVELQATETHLYKAWRSNDRYYRKKYPGFIGRTQQFASWLKFKLLDYVWGNGESITALLRAVVVLIAAIAVLDLYLDPLPLRWATVTNALWRSPQVFFSITVPDHISPGLMTLITVLRFIAFGFFMSILIKRFNRR